MNKVRIILFVCVGVLGAMLPQAKADEWNQKTIFTFSGPVEIPGQVLKPGTYVFKLMDSMSDRNIVEVFNKDETHLLRHVPGDPGLPFETDGQDHHYLRGAGGRSSQKR